MTEWWGKEIPESDEAAPLSRYLARVADDETDLQKVGFVFLTESCAIDKPLVPWSRGP